jgi:hypothetical protein
VTIPGASIFTVFPDHSSLQSAGSPPSTPRKQ